MARDFLTSHVEMVRKQAYTHKRNQGFFGLAIDTRQGFVFLQGLLSGFVLVKALMLLALHENHENCAAYSVSTELEIMQPNPSLSGHEKKAEGAMNCSLHAILLFVLSRDLKKLRHANRSGDAHEAEGW